MFCCFVLFCFVVTITTWPLANGYHQIQKYHIVRGEMVGGGKTHLAVVVEGVQHHAQPVEVLHVAEHGPRGTLLFCEPKGLPERKRNKELSNSSSYVSKPHKNQLTTYIYIYMYIHNDVHIYRIAGKFWQTLNELK